MRLLPRSLFSRLVLVLLGGLVVAQLLSFAVHMHERGELLSRASGRQAAQRIADIARFLDSLDAKERRAIVPVLSAPPLTISLDRAPIAAGDGEAGEGARGALFGGMLRRLLGDDFRAEVAVVEAPAEAPEPGTMRGFNGPKMHGDWPPGKGIMHAVAQPGISFVAQVRLRDGTLVTFDARQPAQTHNWPLRLLLSLAVLLVAVVAVSLVAVRWATRPLNSLADAADELGGNINRPPMKEEGPTEVVRAARAFNTMQARLAGYIRDRTRVLAAMSHDLKTPITRLRLRAEMLPDAELRSRMLRDLHEMQAMVSGTLDFFSAVRKERTRQPVDIGALIDSLCEDRREVGQALSVQGAALAPYPADPQALRRCLENLIENAVRYGACADIRIEDSAARLTIQIRDRGPGIPEPELERVFEPFYRLDDSRNMASGGTGLGLSIARNIARWHGGDVRLSNSAPGLVAELALPR